MIEADAPSTEEVVCKLAERARPTGGSHGLTTRGSAQRCKDAKRRPRQSRRPSAAKRIIRAEVPKDTGLALLQLGLVSIAVDTPRPVACRIVGVIDNAINHST